MKWLRLAYLGLGVVLLAVVVREIDLAEMVSWLRRFDARGAVVVLALYALAFAADTVSWMLTIETVKPRLVRAWQLFVVRLVGEAFNQVIPALGLGGEPVKLQLLKERHGIDYHDGAASLILARTVNLIGLGAFVMLGFGLMLASTEIDAATKGLTALGLAALILGTGAFLMVQRLHVSSRLGGWLGRGGARRGLVRAVAHIEAVEARFVEFYRYRNARFTVALALAALNWLLGAAEVYAAMVFLAHPIEWQDALVIEASTQLVRAATFFIPANVGAQDGALVMLVSMMTGQPALGGALAAIRRAREVGWIALGLAVGAVMHRAPTAPRAPPPG